MRSRPRFRTSTSRASSSSSSATWCRRIHVSIHDASGKSLAIEYTDGGKLSMYDNPAHVFTNSPPFPFHLQNLSQYQYITANVLPPLKVGDALLNAPSSGDGMNGLPGGFLAPARFVRAYFAQANAPKLATSNATVLLAFHVMNGFDLPPGSIGVSATTGGEGGGIDGYETTEWIAVADMKNLRYYIKTYDNMDIRVIDLGKADLNAKADQIHRARPAADGAGPHPIVEPEDLASDANARTADTPSGTSKHIHRHSRVAASTATSAAAAVATSSDYRFHHRDHIVRVGTNYKFGAAAPVVAKY